MREKNLSLPDRARDLALRVGLGVVLFALVGCASGGGLDGRVFRNDELAFRVGEVPSQWRSIDVDGALIAFRDDPGQATIAVNGRCGVDGDDVPLESLTHHLFIHFTDRVVREQQRFDLDGREALLTEISAELDGVRKRFAVVVMKKDGCVYDFLYIADTDAGAGSRASFDAFVRGFATIE